MKLKVSEIFYSLQGEGRFVGVPSVFLRTFGCNFKCEGFGMEPGVKSQERNLVDLTKYKTFEELPLVDTGCDSYASWDPRFKDFSPHYTIDETVDKMLALIPGNDWDLLNGNDVHLVITGGEPLLGWQKLYPELLDHSKMTSLRSLTFETNGTQDLTPTFQEYITTWNGTRGQVTFSVSPKLSASGEAWHEAIKPDVVCQYEQTGSFTYLKFVVEGPEDFDEVDRAVVEYRNTGFMGPVYVMPVGGVSSVYDANRVPVADLALARGYYYSPRLHVDLWGNGWGK